MPNVLYSDRPDVAFIELLAQTVRERWKNSPGVLDKEVQGQAFYAWKKTPCIEERIVTPTQNNEPLFPAFNRVANQFRDNIRISGIIQRAYAIASTQGLDTVPFETLREAFLTMWGDAKGQQDQENSAYNSHDWDDMRNAINASGVLTFHL